MLKETKASVRAQLEKIPATRFTKLAKADDNSDDGIARGLDLDALQGLTGFESFLFDTASDRSEDVLASIGISSDTDFFGHANARAAAYAKNRAAELVTDVDESTRDMLRTVIADGLEAGAMREDIIDSIMASDIFGEERATLIADTEVAMATGQGALAGYKEAQAAGVKLKKVWVCDSDPCPICEENQSAGPIDVSDDFPSGDDSETAHPNCLCHTESVVEEDNADEGDNEE